MDCVCVCVCVMGRFERIDQLERGTKIGWPAQWQLTLSIREAEHLQGLGEG